jgi:hypothetical protein
VFLPNYHSTSRAIFQYDHFLALELPRVAWSCHVLRLIYASLGSCLAAEPLTSAFERLRVFPTFGALAFSSYRQKHISCANECVRAPSDRGHMTRVRLFAGPLACNFPASERRIAGAKPGNFQSYSCFSRFGLTNHCSSGCRLLLGRRRP